MGYLILSEKLHTVKPYYVEDLGVNLYTAEELCYYIYNNVMLLDDSFIDDKLTSFIDSLGYNELSEEINNSKNSYDYKYLLLLILRRIRYYNDDELTQFKIEIDRISSEGVYKLFKEKADHLLKANRIYEAIKMYEKILSSKSITDEITKAEIFRSLGNCHARLYSYSHAIDHFLKAYELSGNIDNLKSIYIIGKLTMPHNYPKELLSEIDSLTINSWEEFYLKTYNTAKFDDEVLEINNIIDDPTESKRLGIMKYISIWKSEFKKIM